MAQLRTSPEEAAASHLGRADWLEAGLGLLVGEGFNAVRITRLAEALGVTRGSFYWHFKDREALLEGLIEIWSGKNSAALLEAVEDAVSLAHGILALLDVWADPVRFDPRLDQAMRDWARQSSAISVAVQEADATRIAAIAALYRRFGYDRREAMVRAKVLYFAQVGSHALPASETLAQRLADLEAYYESFTGRLIAAETAEAFRRRHAETSQSLVTKERSLAGAGR